MLLTVLKDGTIGTLYMGNMKNKKIKITVGIIFLAVVVMRAYLNGKDSVDENGVVWIRTDKISDLKENKIPLGTVKLSDNLKWGMMRYSKDTRFAVAVSYAYLTEKEIYQLTCSEDEALYILAVGLLK